MKKEFEVIIKIPVSFQFNIKAEKKISLFRKIKNVLKDIGSIEASIFIDDKWKKLTSGKSYEGHTVLKGIHDFNSAICIREKKEKK